MKISETLPSSRYGTLTPCEIALESLVLLEFRITLPVGWASLGKFKVPLGAAKVPRPARSRWGFEGQLMGWPSVDRPLVFPTQTHDSYCARSSPSAQARRFFPVVVFWRFVVKTWSIARPPYNILRLQACVYQTSSLQQPPPPPPPRPNDYTRTRPRTHTHKPWRLS